MELNVEIDAIVLYGVERVDHEHLAAQIARRLEFRALTEELADRAGAVSRFSRGPLGGHGSEARPASQSTMASAAGGSLGERVADAIWHKLHSGGQRQ